jgi:predicted ArsR family transcriptional regulator
MWRGSGDVVGDQARAAAGPGANREWLLACTCEALTECGYAPHRADGTIVLSNCPFDTVARAHTQLICGMDLAMLAAASSNSKRPRWLPARTRNRPVLCRLDAS